MLTMWDVLFSASLKSFICFKNFNCSVWIQQLKPIYTDTDTVLSMSFVVTCKIGSLRYGDYGLRTTAGRALSFVCSTGLSRANIER